ncbi:MAG: AAA family ATPase [Acidimicrobiia bacterium]|nr:AAA family ATPase [Acidimicrobiia bacterium]
MRELLGDTDRHLRLIEGIFDDVTFVVRGNVIALEGTADAVRRAEKVIEELLILVQEGESLDHDRIERVVGMVDENVDKPADILTDGVTVGRGKLVRPKTKGQHTYLAAIKENTLTFGIGPAGTGKTYLAMAAAVEALLSGSVRRIVLTRPAVEAGERLGFLPGDLTAKVDPYLRPLYDALWDMLGPEETTKLSDRGMIEIAPLAYMRGRTLNDAFVILDEAQNTTPEQMKMFLTRLGFNSKMVITGDVTQTDLPDGRSSGLVIVESILSGIDGVSFVRLGARDVVRHRIVASIVDAYAAHESST